MTAREMNESGSDILIAVAHPSEEEAVREAAGISRCEIIVTGVGGAAMSWALQKRFAAGPRPSLVIGAGIAGSYVAAVNTGEVVVVRSECFADMGVDDNGTFLSLFRANLADPDSYPFSGGRIHCSGTMFDLAARKYRTVTAATVNMSSGSAPVIERILKAWDPEIETMEGAWLAYTCAMAHTGWLSVRAISNMVEPRNTGRWDISLALHNLKKAMGEILKMTSES
jgi:futalosine hydrolase